MALLAFGLLHERRVDIQYYELNIQPGNPKKQFLRNLHIQGDIRMRSRSPRHGLRWRSSSRRRHCHL